MSNHGACGVPYPGLHFRNLNPYGPFFFFSATCESAYFGPSIWRFLISEAGIFHHQPEKIERPKDDNLYQLVVNIWSNGILDCQTVASEYGIF